MPAAVVLALSACAGRPSQGVLTPVAETAEGTSRVPVLAVGTRARAIADPGEMFSGERAEGLSYAAVTVSVPPDAARTFGEVQWPASLPGDPRRDFVAVSADYLERRSFVAAITKLAKQTGYREVLIFVHGYNNRFDDAVYRLAQIVHDSKAPVIPVLFTWPSRGEILAYTYDRESANYSRDALEEVMDDLAAQPSVKEISILAHSMGNWVTLEALRQKSIRTGKIADKIKNVMLAAPDVDVDVFRTQIHRMGAARPQFTLFVSQDDRALRLSEHIWGDVPRLGQIDPIQEPYRSEFERERITVLDMTKLKAPDGNRHDKFAELPSTVGLIGKRLTEGQEITDRAANPVDHLKLLSNSAPAKLRAIATDAIK